MASRYILRQHDYCKLHYYLLSCEARGKDGCFDIKKHLFIPIK